MKEKFTFFWHGPFSQWYMSRFIADGIEFNCAEQYMMFHKAQLFEDYETARLILDTKYPKEQKKLGRQVIGFDPTVWNIVAKNIVTEGNIQKFLQNEELLKLLLATKGTYLVEASPYDRIWGIGLRATSPDAQQRETWRGLNWLGDCLVDVREQF